jgi:hypothetical protein
MMSLQRSLWSRLQPKVGGTAAAQIAWAVVKASGLTKDGLEQGKSDLLSMDPDERVMVLKALDASSQRAGDHGQTARAAMAAVRAIFGEPRSVPASEVRVVESAWGPEVTRDESSSPGMTADETADARVAYIGTLHARGVPIIVAVELAGDRYPRHPGEPEFVTEGLEAE